MPAQPLSSVRRNATVVILQDTLLRHPELGALVAQTLSMCSSIDSALALILSKLFSADYGMIAAMYAALTGEAARKQALLTAAKEKLSDDEFKLFQAILSVMKTTRNRRNEFAHHIWGESPDLPDALLLIDPKMHVSFDVALRRFRDFGIMSQLFKGKWSPPPTPEIDRSLVAVYRKKELEEVCEAALLDELLVWQFAAYLNDGTEAGEAHRWLLAEPRVAQALEAQSQ